MDELLQHTVHIVEEFERLAKDGGKFGVGGHKHDVMLKSQELPKDSKEIEKVAITQLSSQLSEKVYLFQIYAIFWVLQS